MGCVNLQGTYKNFVQVGQDVKEMIKDVQNKRNAK